MGATEGKVLIEVKMVPNGIDGKGYNFGIEKGCAVQPVVTNPIEISPAQDKVTVAMVSIEDGFGIVVSLDPNINPLDASCDGLGVAPCDANNLDGINKTLCDKSFNEKCFDECGRGGSCDEQNCRSACDESFTTTCKHYIICTNSQHPEVNADGCGTFEDLCGKQRCCPCDEGWGFDHTQANVEECDFSKCDPALLNFAIEYPSESVGWGETILPVEEDDAECFCGQNNPIKYKIVGLEQADGFTLPLDALDEDTGAFTAPIKPDDGEKCPIVLIQKSCSQKGKPDLLAVNQADQTIPNVWRLQIRDPLIPVGTVFRMTRCYMEVRFKGGEGELELCKFWSRDTDCQEQATTPWIGPSLGANKPPGFYPCNETNDRFPPDPPEFDDKPPCCPECFSAPSICCLLIDLRTSEEVAANICCPLGTVVLDYLS